MSMCFAKNRHGNFHRRHKWDHGICRWCGQFKDVIAMERIKERKASKKAKL